MYCLLVEVFYTVIIKIKFHINFFQCGIYISITCICGCTMKIATGCMATSYIYYQFFPKIKEIIKFFVYSYMVTRLSLHANQVEVLNWNHEIDDMTIS